MIPRSKSHSQKQRSIRRRAKTFDRLLRKRAAANKIQRSNGPSNNNTKSKSRKINSWNLFLQANSKKPEYRGLDMAQLSKRLKSPYRKHLKAHKQTTKKTARSKRPRRVKQKKRVDKTKQLKKKLDQSIAQLSNQLKKVESNQKKMMKELEKKKKTLKKSVRARKTRRNPKKH